MVEEQVQLEVLIPTCTRNFSPTKAKPSPSSRRNLSPVEQALLQVGLAVGSRQAEKIDDIDVPEKRRLPLGAKLAPLPRF